MATDLLARLREPVVVDSVRLGVQASIGIAVAPQDADSFETLLKRADIALYRAKSNRGDIQSYRPEIDGYTIERLALLGDLHAAVDNDEFVLAFQPQVCARTGDVLSVEALEPVAAPAARARQPRRLHPAGREQRPDQPAQPLGHRAGGHDPARLARPRPRHLDGRQRLGPRC